MVTEFIRRSKLVVGVFGSGIMLALLFLSADIRVTVYAPPPQGEMTRAAIVKKPFIDTLDHVDNITLGGSSSNIKPSPTSKAEHGLKYGDEKPRDGEKKQRRTQQALSSAYVFFSANSSFRGLTQGQNVSANVAVRKEIAYMESSRLRFEKEMAELRLKTIGEPIVYNRDQIPPELMKLAPNVFQKFPRKFLPEYKSPCWRGSANYLQCLPYFFLGGFPKCATTDLWGKLVEHPAIIQTTKEPHWWTATDLQMPSQYLQNYLKAGTLMAIKKQTNLVTVDGSALLFQDNRKLLPRMPTSLANNRTFLTVDILRAVLPNTKIIGLVRNPTERAYSAYLYFETSLKSKRDFHERVQQAIQEYYECTEKYGVEFCAYVKIKQLHINTGCYSLYIRDFLKRFPREQLYFLRTEDWSRNRTGYLRDIFSFLHLDPMTDSARRRVVTGNRLNARKPKDSRIGPMLPETRALLDEFYRPCNRDLAHILGDDKYLWLDDATT